MQRLKQIVNFIKNEKISIVVSIIMFLLLYGVTLVVVNNINDALDYNNTSSSPYIISDNPMSPMSLSQLVSIFIIIFAICFGIWEMIRSC